MLNSEPRLRKTDIIFLMSSYFPLLHLLHKKRKFFIKSPDVRGKMSFFKQRFTIKGNLQKCYAAAAGQSVAIFTLRRTSILPAVPGG